MSQLTRTDIADDIVTRLRAEAQRARDAFAASGPIRHAVIDDLLPPDTVNRLSNAFPNHDDMMLKRTLREDKYVGVQMDQFDPILEECVYAFQDPRIVELVTTITGLTSLEPDVHLYAGGISSMGRGQFLNPHVDNSHDKDRERWRVLNLLYYVTPGWDPHDGGQLELWPSGLREPPITIGTTCNRLVIMETHQRSLHSVSPITGLRHRQCISNYYFSAHPARATDSFHVTSFRGRPGQHLRDIALRADAALRMGLRVLFRRGVRENPHVYRRQ